MHPAVKTRAAMTGVMAVVLAASGVAVGYAWHTRNVVNRVIAQRTADMLAVTELDARLLKQRGYVAAYIMDNGNREWLRQQDELEPLFRAKLEQLQRDCRDPEEQGQLTRVRQSFDRYDAVREEVVSLYAGGRADEAKAAFVGKMMVAYREVTAACDELVEANRREIAAALVEGSAGMARLSILVTASAVLTTLLGLGLMWALQREVFGPLQHITRDIEGMSNGSDPSCPLPQPADVTAVGIYLRMLISEVRTSREDLVRSRQEAQHSGRLAAVGNAVARLAHEIKNALVPIGGFARLIERAPDDKERVRENAQIIYRSAYRLESTIREVLEFSRPSREALCAQAVNAAVQEALAGLSAQVPEGIIIESDLDPATPAVPLPPGGLERVVANLVGNAVDVLGERGRVRVRTRPQGTGATVLVSDDGPGMSEDVRKRVFDPFFTTKRKGTGLGLAICRQIITDLGGSIDVESAPAQGATFTVFLPSGAVEVSDRK